MMMVEKVARAICRENVAYNGPKDGRFADQRVDEEWQDHIPDARAALTALLEPSEGMVSASSDRAGHGFYIDGTPAAAVDFKKMIQAALDEKEG